MRPLSSHAPTITSARDRISSSKHLARPTSGTGSSSDGSTLTPHRVVDAVGWPKSLASVCLRQLQTTRARLPFFSAASWSRRLASIGSRTTSPTTAPSPPKDNASSIEARTSSSRSLSTKITRLALRPACASAGKNRSGRVRHQTIFPLVRAATPATNSAAAAPSTVPAPPPANS